MRLCRCCGQIKNISLFPKHKNYIDGIDTRCIDCKKEYHQKYQKNNLDKWEKYKQNNRERIAEKAREYRKNNKNLISIKDVIRKRNRRHTDILFALTHRIRARVSCAYNGKLKSLATEKLIGCSYEEFKVHIEKQFTNGMGWENRKLWHIDHIIPICHFDLNNNEEALKAFHYTNCRPLWAKDNLSKGSKLTINSDMLKESA